MKRVWVTILTICFLCSPAVVRCDSLENPQKENPIVTEKHVLDNGLTVLTREMPSSQVVSIYCLVKTGSATEGKYLGTGISHFLEHMLFKGTEKREVGAVSREIQALGGVINASTSFDYTIYTITVPERGFDKALDIMADMMMHSRFDADEIEKEREVIYGEMRLYKDRPARYLSRMVFNTVYKKHPYRLPIIGYEELLRELKRDDFLDYYHRHYIPNNMILSVAGKFETQAVLPKVKEAFKDFQRQRFVPRNLPREPAQVTGRRYEEQYPTELTRMSLSYAGVSLFDEDMYAMDVLAMILGQGESSRLYLDLFKQKKMVRSITASNFTPMDRGLFEIECVLDEENVERTIQAVGEHIEKIGQRGVDSSELEKTKRQVLSHHIQAHQTSGSVAYGTATDEAFTGDFDYSKKYVDGIRRVTNRDVQRVARAYLTDNALSVVILKPKHEGTAQEKRAQKKKEARIEKIELANGLTILLREDHTFPLISINLALQGGTRYEEAALNGISDLTSRLWVKGTTSRTAEQISKSVETLGAGLSGFSGRNSFGISLSLLAEDLDFGIPLLEDLIKHPTFDEKELVKEKEKMKTSIIARDDDIHHVTAMALRKMLFKTHPYRLEGLGTLESIEGLTRQDVVALYTKLSTPSNMVLSVFGDFQTSTVKETLKKRLSKLKDRPMSAVTHQEMPPQETRDKTIYLDKKQAMVMTGFQGVSFFDADRYGIEVLSSILGSSFSGRIFKKVRDEMGEAYTLGGGFTPGMDMGMITFYVSTTEEKAAQVKQILTDLIRQIQEKDVPQQELDDMKSYLKGTFQMGIETNASLGFISTLDELYGLGYDRYQAYEAGIDRVTAEDVRRLAQKYLDINRAAVVIARPKANSSESQLQGD